MWRDRCRRCTALLHRQQRNLGLSRGGDPRDASRPALGPSYTVFLRVKQHHHLAAELDRSAECLLEDELHDRVRARLRQTSQSAEGRRLVALRAEEERVVLEPDAEQERLDGRLPPR